MNYKIGDRVRTHQSTFIDCTFVTDEGKPHQALEKYDNGIVNVEGTVVRISSYSIVVLPDGSKMPTSFCNCEISPVLHLQDLELLI